MESGQIISFMIIVALLAMGLGVPIVAIIALIYALYIAVSFLKGERDQ